MPLQADATRDVFEQLQGMGLAPPSSLGPYRRCHLRLPQRSGGTPGEKISPRKSSGCGQPADMPFTGSAPGADDNGSGSAALLTAANIMSRYRFQRTIRFVFFTGEEQGFAHRQCQLCRRGGQPEDRGGIKPGHDCLSHANRAQYNGDTPGSSATGEPRRYDHCQHFCERGQ